MYLKRLELHGFKSFAHKTVLDFDPGMTAVVGPNGSGKSNVADALRWVMGEQSLKLLRGKKSEDVIFAGSDKKSKLSMAEVSLTFDNKDRKMPLEYMEVVISRRLYRNGESEYLINNQRARLLDIVDVLLASGFGGTNYAVIGQGTIDNMVLAGPSEIKSLVEEAAGVKPYYIKRDKTKRRLEQTEENLSSITALINEIEPRLRSLKRQAKRMEERETVANELALLQLQFFGQQLAVLKTELSATSEQVALKDTAVKKLEAEVAGFEKSWDKEEQQTEQAEIFLEELEKKLAELESRRLVLVEQLAEIKGKLKVEVPVTKNFSEFRQKFEAILDLLRAENVEEIKHKLRELVSLFGESKNEELLKQKKVLSQELEQIVAEMNEQRRVKQQMEAEAKQKKNFLSEEEKKFRAKSSEIIRVKDELNKLLVEKAKLDTRLESLTHEAKEALGQRYEELSNYKSGQIIADLPNKISRLKRQLEMTGGVDEVVLTEYRETSERFEYLSGQLKDLTKAVEDLQSVIEELDEIIKTQFNEAFHKISQKFAEYFRILFNGGRAQMNLIKAEVGEVAEDGMDDLSPDPSPPEERGVLSRRESKEIVGIEVKATPPGKKLASITALSGGERALTAIALLCSFLACYPSPFVVLDEVDAALDEANSLRFAKILGTLAHQTQFITITHNRETMRQAHTLYGVTMDDHGVSKILSLKLDKAEEIAE
ncbi:MAG: AAA family ATPase [Candidatus Doudnabacteria bacterium]|nr:AAA family ATPase [Candidatus Doudnabacteria bacterium]